MALKCYIAAPWVHKADALAAKTAFEEAGLEVTSRWITSHHEDAGYATGASTTSDEVLAQSALEDINDIFESDVFVILNLGKSEGKATEMGFAHAIGLPIILVGTRQGNVFYHLPGVFRADTIEKAIEGLKSANNLEYVWQEGSDAGDDEVDAGDRQTDEPRNRQGDE